MSKSRRFRTKEDAMAACIASIMSEPADPGIYVMDPRVWQFNEDAVSGDRWTFKYNVLRCVNDYAARVQNREQVLADLLANVA